MSVVLYIHLHQENNVTNAKTDSLTQTDSGDKFFLWKDQEIGDSLLFSLILIYSFSPETVLSVNWIFFSSERFL